MRRLTGCLVAIAVLATACGEDEPDESSATTSPDDSAATTAPSTERTDVATTAPPTTEAATTTTVDLAAGLRDRTFLSTAVEGYTLVPATRISLTFEGDAVAANAGCNNLSSTWALEGDVLVVADMVTTDMACEPSTLMDQDIWLASVLSTRPTVTLAGPDLTLTAEGATVTFDRPGGGRPGPATGGDRLAGREPGDGRRRVLDPRRCAPADARVHERHGAGRHRLQPGERAGHRHRRRRDVRADRHDADGVRRGVEPGRGPRARPSSRARCRTPSTPTC